jgi:hypothetical protein
MKKALSRVTTKLYHYKGDIKVDGTNGEMIGDCSGLSGDCTRLRGNCTRLYGDCSGLVGDCTGLYGDCTSLRGDLYECDITDEDRKKGIDIAELVGEKD